MICIRSQQKEFLIKANNLYIENIEKLGFFILCYSNFYEKSFALGKYSTKEKALKVMDMIQERICNLELYDTEVATNRTYLTVKKPERVFQMPLDSEVEEDDS